MYHDYDYFFYLQLRVAGMMTNQGVVVAQMSSGIPAPGMAGMQAQSMWGMSTPSMAGIQTQNMQGMAGQQGMAAQHGMVAQQGMAAPQGITAPQGMAAPGLGCQSITQAMGQQPPE